jgi:hypothetical protein
MKIDLVDDFITRLMNDWGKDDIFGPWIVINKNSNILPQYELYITYKSYYLIQDDKIPDIELLPELNDISFSDI